MSRGTAAASTGCGPSGSIADQSGFEDADGNLAIDKAGCMDWNGFAPVTWSGSAPYQAAAKTVGAFTFWGVSDAFNSQADTIYAGGVKQGDECPATGIGNVDNKADLARIYVAASTDPVTGHIFLDLAWVRAPQNTTSSDVHVSFELNQSATPCSNGSPLVKRTAGDILLVYNFQSGVASIAYSQWTGSAWTPEVTLSSSVAEAKVFEGTSTVDAIKPSNGLNPGTDEFGEAGVDLTAATVNLTNNGSKCESFGTAFGESRTSGSSTTAQMKDLVGPAHVKISNCATPSITTTQMPASGSVGDTYKDTATISGGRYDGTGSLTFKLYSAPDCGGSVLDTETVTGISADGNYTTPNGLAIQSPGTYYWVASFSGDGYDNPSSSGCNDEPVVVNPPAIQILKTPDAVQVSAGDPIGFTITVWNSGAGDAKGVTLSDPLPTNAGLNWTIDAQGAGWNNSCAIANGTLTCGPVTVPAGTTQAASTYTVHITSPTTAATGGSCPNTGVVSNTGTVTTTNGGSGQSSASTCVAKPSIEIVKTADAAQVSAGDPIGFTLTVWNSGGGDAKGVTLSDPLPTNPGLNWQIANQGAGWGGSCAIANGMLTCGPATVPGNTTEAASTFTVHITSTTTSATGGTCPNGDGVVSNTGSVTTTNDGSGQSTATTCVAAPSIQILKTADAAQVSAGDPIGFTITVWNSGAGDAKGVTLSDPLPTNAGLNWTIDAQGAGWGNSCAITNGTLTCGPVTVPAGTTQAASTYTVHITSPTTADTGGSCPNSGVVSNTGTVTTTNGGSGQSSASTCVASAAIHILKTADAVQVNAGDQIGFTVTVYNTGTGDAKNVTLSDPLPTNLGLNWQIETQGAGWNGSCSITNGTLNCGPVTVPFGTTLAGSPFTVHIVSTTTADTGGVCPGGSGVVTNTGTVSTSNAGTDQSTASTCVAGATVAIAKTADAALVAAGSQIGFTLTVSNSGTGAANGVTVSDPLPTNPGLDWQIDTQGAGWNGSCAIAGGTLTCGPVSVPAGTTPAASTYTVHIVSSTTEATGGSCPGTGDVNNTGTVNSTNAGSGQASATTCVQGLTDLQITKSGAPADQTVTQLPGGSITWTMVVTNNGPLADTHVVVADPMPAGATFVSVATAPTPDLCTGGVILQCALGTMQAGQSVTITLITTPTQEGTITNTATVVGDLAESSYGNNQASASVQVHGVVRPPACTVAKLIKPRTQIYAGRVTRLEFKLTLGKTRNAVKGVRVQIHGAAQLKGFHLTTKPSNRHGLATATIKPKTRGILYFTPLVTKPNTACGSKFGVTDVFTPPVTG